MTAALNSSFISLAADAWLLHSITDSLVSSIEPAAASRGNHFINDITDDICVDANRELLANVIAGLICAVNSQVKDSKIRLTAKQYTDVILIHLKDYNKNEFIIIDRKIQALAEKMGGFVGVCSRRNNLTTIAFCFPNLPLDNELPDENCNLAA